MSLKKILKKNLTNLDDNLKSSFFDLTNVFNNVKYEVYIDSGHLNRLGNLIIELLWLIGYIKTKFLK